MGVLTWIVQIRRTVSMRNDPDLRGVCQSMAITMYGADWCGDCRRAKAYLAEHGVPFTYVDLIERPEAMSIVLERNNGTEAIPVVVFADNSHLTEPSNADLEQKLKELATQTARVVENRVVEKPAVEKPAVEKPAVKMAEADDRGDERTAAGKFELWFDSQLLSFAIFDEVDGVVTVPHVETAPQHRGNGNAATLMDGLLGLLRSSNRTIVPLCSFAADHVRSNKRHHDLVAR